MVVQDESAKILLALQFLTRIPIPGGVLYTEQRFADTPRYYPLVGAFVGLLCAALLLAAVQVFPQTLAVSLMVAGGILLTGAFHEDGLADTFDGVGGGQDRDKALNIMKDSRLGTYGTLAIGLVLLCKIVALASLSVDILVIGLIAGHALSRLSSIAVMATSDYVRDHGTGKPVSTGISRNSLFIAFATGLICLLMVFVFVSATALVYGLLGLAAGHGFMRFIYERRLGGYTGDTLGAVQQMSELGFYLGLVAWV